MTQTQNVFLSPIRPTVRAVIFRDAKLLVQTKQKPGQPPYLTLPGGKQEPGETAVEALVRECAEEIAAMVTVGPLLHVAEVFRAMDEGTRHQLELLFSCEVPAGYEPVIGPRPDPSQIGTEWVSPVSRADAFRPAYGAALGADGPGYLGVFDG